MSIIDGFALGRYEDILIHMKRRLKKALVTVVGFFVLVAGIIMIPYPGPGWGVVILGLIILATEYVWARRARDFVKARYDAWREWVSKQNRALRAIFWLTTALIVVMTIWLLNGYGFINDWLNLGIDGLQSPLPFFS